MGDVRDQMALDLQRMVDGIIRTRKDDRPYYILVHGRPASPGSNEILTKIIITYQEPPKLQATLCYRVDNREGIVERLWVLPLDIPRTDLVHNQGDHGEIVEEVYRSAQGQLILH